MNSEQVPNYILHNYIVRIDLKFNSEHFALDSSDFRPEFFHCVPKEALDTGNNTATDLYKCLDINCKQSKATRLHITIKALLLSALHLK